MTSIFDLNLNDAQEPQVVPAGEEYKLRITKVRVDNDKNGNPYLLPTFEIPDIAASKEFTKFLGFPKKDDSPKTANNKKWRIKEFMLAFGLDPSKKYKNPEVDFVGKTGWAILGIENDEEYGDKNYVKRFIVPK